MLRIAVPSKATAAKSLGYAIGAIILCSLLESCASGVQPATLSTKVTKTAYPTSTHVARPTDNANSSTLSPVTPGNSMAAGGSTPETGTVIFSLSTMNHSTPNDVLQEADFYLGGGGGFHCSGDETEPVADLDPLPADRELMEPVNLWVCGWTSNETVRIVIEDPIGGISHLERRTEADAGGRYHLMLDFTPTMSDQAGLYHFTFQGRRDQISKSVYIAHPFGPRIRRPNPEESLLLLYNFQPEEKVRLFVYGSSLEGWNELQVDKNGQLVVKLDPGIVQLGPIGWKDYTFAALGEISGEAHDDRYRALLDKSILIFDSKAFVVHFDCNGAPASRIHVGDNARVTFLNGKKVRIHIGPGVSFDVIGSIPEGAKIEVINGPECRDRLVWWRVVGNGGADGWLAEGEAGNYFIEPWQ